MEKKNSESGINVSQIAERMDVKEEYVREFIGT
jgi:hypothetical protein